MKKLLAILLALVMCMTLLPLAALAESDDTRTVYAKVPDGWGDVYLYAWEDGSNGDPAWPGVKMNVSTQDGWYEATIPAKYTYAIVNNNNNGKQTPNLDLLSGTNYITAGYVNEAVYGSVSGDATTGADNGIMTVYAKVPESWGTPHLHIFGGGTAAEWPGVAMKESAYSGWYELQIPKGTPKCVVTTGGGAPQTGDLELAKGNFITVGDNGEVTQTTTVDGKPTPFKINTVTAVGNGVEGESYLNGENWKQDSTKNVMANNNGVYSITYTNVKSGDHDLKFVFNGEWGQKSLGGGEIKTGTQVNVDCGKGTGNMKFHVDQDGSTVKLELDLTNFDYDNGTGAKLTITVTTPNNAKTGDSTQLVAIAAALLVATTGMVATVAGKTKFF